MAPWHEGVPGEIDKIVACWNHCHFCNSIIESRSRKKRENYSSIPLFDQLARCLTPPSETTTPFICSEGGSFSIACERSLLLLGLYHANVKKTEQQEKAKKSCYTSIVESLKGRLS